MNMKPRIFIGSTAEASKKNYPWLIHTELSKWFCPDIWEEAFSLSSTSIESLERTFKSSDAFVFILTADDIVVSRDITQPCARDNILFEVGLAMGCKGRRDVFLILIKPEKDGQQKCKIPSDLLGVTYAEVDFQNRSEVKQSCQTIKDQYFENHHEDIEQEQQEAIERKIKDIADEIRDPIKEINENIATIGKSIVSEIAVLSGAQKAGIVNIFPNRYDRISNESLTDCIARELETTKHTVNIMGISLGDFFLDRGMMHKRFLSLLKRSFDPNTDNKKSDLCIRALIVDPKCDALIERAYWEAGKEYCEDQNSYSDSTTYIETDGAIRIARRLQSNHTSLEVRFYEQAPTCFLLYTRRFAFVENYTYASRGSNCPIIQIEADNGNNPLYNLYQQHFENIWNYAKPAKAYDSLSEMEKERFFKYTKRVAHTPTKPFDSSEVPNTTKTNDPK